MGACSVIVESPIKQKQRVSATLDHEDALDTDDEVMVAFVNNLQTKLDANHKHTNESLTETLSCKNGNDDDKQPDDIQCEYDEASNTLTFLVDGNQKEPINKLM